MTAREALSRLLCDKSLKHEREQRKKTHVVDLGTWAQRTILWDLFFFTLFVRLFIHSFVMRACHKFLLRNRNVQIPKQVVWNAWNRNDKVRTVSIVFVYAYVCVCDITPPTSFNSRQINFSASNQKQNERKKCVKPSINYDWQSVDLNGSLIKYAFSCRLLLASVSLAVYAYGIWLLKPVYAMITHHHHFYNDNEFQTMTSN